MKNPSAVAEKTIDLVGEGAYQYADAIRTFSELTSASDTAEGVPHGTLLQQVEKNAVRPRTRRGGP